MPSPNSVRREDTSNLVNMPPEATFWRHYSPHHEFPMSALASIVLHFFIALVLTMFGTMIFSWGTDQKQVVLEAVGFQGGGGPGDGAAATEEPLRDLEQDISNNQQTFTKLDFPVIEALDARDAELTESNANVFNGVKNIGRPGDRGLGGNGTGGGRGNGNGRNVGDGDGDGTTTPRQKRTDRWIINFKFNSPEELAKQLANIEAHLLIPTNIPGQYKLFRNLEKRPLTSEDIDQSGMRKNNRIWYSSANSKACAAVAVAFGVAPVPKYFAIFIPNGLEVEMLNQELGYKGLTEAKIVERNLETYFNISKSGNVWNVKVIEQRRKE